MQPHTASYAAALAFFFTSSEGSPLAASGAVLGFS